MVNANLNIKAGSPLGCCNPKEERKTASPVFRQQYVSDNGKMKLTMPVSPMHYITNSTYYANDFRLAQPQPQPQWEATPQVPYPHMYDPQVIHMPQRRVHDALYGQPIDTVPNRRMPTPNLQAMIQQRQVSAQVNRPPNGVPMQPSHAVMGHAPPKVGLAELQCMLERVERKLIEVEQLCKSNETGLLTLIKTLKANDAEETNKKEQEGTEAPMAPPSAVPTAEFPNFREMESIDSSVSSKASVSSAAASKGTSQCSASSNSDQLLKHNSLAVAPQGYEVAKAEYGSTVFDVSQELRKSNDMLERFLSNSAILDNPNPAEMPIEHENVKMALINRTASEEANADSTEHMAPNVPRPLSLPQLGKGQTLDVRPLVTTASMVPSDVSKNQVLETLEKRFQVLMNAFDGQVMAVNGMAPQQQAIAQQVIAQQAIAQQAIAQQAIAQQAIGQPAIGNDDGGAEQLSLAAPPAEANGSLALINSGGLALQGDAATAITGTEVALVNRDELAKKRSISNESLALALQGERGITPATTQSQAHMLIEQYQAGVAMIKAASNGSSAINERDEESDGTSELSSQGSHKITCAMLPDNDEDAESDDAFRQDSIRGLNTSYD